MVKWDFLREWATVTNWLVFLLSVQSINRLSQIPALCKQWFKDVASFLIRARIRTISESKAQELIFGCAGLFLSHTRQDFHLHLFRFFFCVLWSSHLIFPKKIQKEVIDWIYPQRVDQLWLKFHMLLFCASSYSKIRWKAYYNGQLKPAGLCYDHVDAGT